MIRSPEPDIYGQYARASLLADYVELTALKGRLVRRADVADFLADSGSRWDLDLIEPAGNGILDEDDQPQDLPERLADADEKASIVFRQLDERRHVLAERYPFEITEDVVALGAHVDVRTSVYAAVLALTVAHAFKVGSVYRPEEMFERIVAQVLRSRGLSSTGLAAHRRRGKTFEAALRTACEEVGLKAAPDEVARLRLAHDEGVDVLCHLGWESDLRPGTWGFIGQVTVGRSDSWEKKAKEPSPNQWKRFASTLVPPSPFLAVPHHVERGTMEWLVSKCEAVVLDRLRLVPFKEENDDEEREVIQGVLEEDIEPFTG